MENTSHMFSCACFFLLQDTKSKCNKKQITVVSVVWCKCFEKTFMIQPASSNECLCNLKLNLVHCTVCALKSCCFVLGGSVPVCTLLQPVWNLHGMMIKIINNDAKLCGQHETSSPTDITKRHQRGTCHLDLCYSWKLTPTIFFVARNCTILKADSRTKMRHCHGVKILK